MKRIWKRPQAILLALLLAVGVGGYSLAVTEHPSNAVVDVKVAPVETGTHAGFAPIVKKVLPAVVSISSSKATKVSAQDFGPSPDDPIFQYFFGRDNRQFQAPERQQVEHALGSGVIMSPDGYILTNNHVVDGATSLRVVLSDKREFDGKLVGADAKSDIALLKIPATGLPSITVGDSSKVEVGDYALAVGNPFGVGQTVTMGIVSATGRTNLGIEDYEDFIQTDAPINPGNSGGALVNDRGELIGINTAIISHGSDGNQGIGFAIPANMARSVMSQIAQYGKVTRAYLGIVPQDVTPALAKAFGIKESRGALVGGVSAGSPADSSGLKRGDVIREVDGKPVADSNALRMMISMNHPGSSVDLKVLRDDAERNVRVTLGELPTEQAAVSRSSDAATSPLAGVSVGEATGNDGVSVTNVDPASKAAEAGLRRGDVIQEVNRQPIHNAADFNRALRGSSDQTLLLVRRNGDTMYIVV